MAAGDYPEGRVVISGEFIHEQAHDTSEKGPVETMEHIFKTGLLEVGYTDHNAGVLSAQLKDQIMPLILSHAMMFGHALRVGDCVRKAYSLIMTAAVSRGYLTRGFDLTNGRIILSSKDNEEKNDVEFQHFMTWYKTFNPNGEN
jgi:hypothetical protein